MHPEIKEHLIRARDKIKDPNNWCTGHYAKTISDTNTSSRSSIAVKWCALGAINATEYIEFSTRTEVHRVINEMVHKIYGPTVGISTVNDEYGHKKIIEIFDKVIEDQ